MNQPDGLFCDTCEKLKRGPWRRMEAPYYCAETERYIGKVTDACGAMGMPARPKLLFAAPIHCPKRARILAQLEREAEARWRALYDLADAIEGL